MEKVVTKSKAGKNLSKLKVLTGVLALMVVASLFAVCYFEVFPHPGIFQHAAAKIQVPASNPLSVQLADIIKETDTNKKVKNTNRADKLLSADKAGNTDFQSDSSGSVVSRNIAGTDSGSKAAVIAADLAYQASKRLADSLTALDGSAADSATRVSKAIKDLYLTSAATLKAPASHPLSYSAASSPPAVRKSKISLTKTKYAALTVSSPTAKNSLFQIDVEPHSTTLGITDDEPQTTLSAAPTAAATSAAAPLTTATSAATTSRAAPSAAVTSTTAAISSPVLTPSPAAILSVATTVGTQASLPSVPSTTAAISSPALTPSPATASSGNNISSNTVASKKASPKLSAYKISMSPVESTDGITNVDAKTPEVALTTDDAAPSMIQVASFDNHMSLNPAQISPVRCELNEAEPLQLSTPALPSELPATTALFQNSTAIRDLLASGDARLLLNDYTGAYNAYNSAITLAPDSAAGYVKRAGSRLAMNDVPGAFADYTKAIGLTSKNGDAYKGRAVARARMNDLQGSLADYNTIIELSTQNISDPVSRGTLDLKAKNYKQAVIDYSFAIQLDKTDKVSYRRRAEAEFYLKKYAEALIDYSKAIHIDPNYTEAYINRGVVRSILKEKDNAYIDFLKAKDLGDGLADSYMRKYAN